MLKKKNLRYFIVFVLFCMPVLLSSCAGGDMPVSSQTSIAAKAPSGLDEAVLSGISYERMITENRQGALSVSCKIGEYLLFTDMGAYQIPGSSASHLVLMKQDGTQRRVIFTSENLIGHVQVVDASRIAFSVLTLVEPELALYEYYYFNLKTGETVRFSENPTNDPEAVFMYPVWANGTMIFQMFVENPNQHGESVNGIIRQLYCKTPAGETVLLAQELSDYYVNGKSLYLLEAGAEHYRVFDLGTGEFLQSQLKEDQRMWGNYLVDFSEESPLFINQETGERCKMSVPATTANFVGRSATHVYFIYNNGIYSVSFANGAVEQVANRAGMQVDVYEGCIVYPINISESSVAAVRPYIAYSGSIETQSLFLE